MSVPAGAVAPAVGQPAAAVGQDPVPVAGAAGNVAPAAANTPIAGTLVPAAPADPAAAPPAAATPNSAPAAISAPADPLATPPATQPGNPITDPAVQSSPPLSSDPTVTDSLQSAISAISSGSTTPSPTSAESDSKSKSPSSSVSSTSSSSPSPTQSQEHDDHKSQWDSMKGWVIPVAAIVGCLLFFSLIGRLISLSRRKKRHQNAHSNGGKGGDPRDDYGEDGGFLTKNISSNQRHSAEGPSEKYGGRRSNTNNINHSSLHQFDYGGGAPPPEYKEPHEAELGYDDDELRGRNPGRKPTYMKGWTWMKKTFTNDEAFGSRTNQGPPMKRSVLSFVNLSPFSDRGARADKAAGLTRYDPANGGASHFWSPIASPTSQGDSEIQVTSPADSGWRDASSRPFTSTDRASAGRFQVPRRPVNRSYMPVSNMESDGRPSIAAVLAADSSNNRLAADRPGEPSNSDPAALSKGFPPSRSPTGRSKPETGGGIAAWRDAMRKISAGGYSYKREHERVPSTDPDDDGSGAEEDGPISPSARQTSYSYRSVSQEYDPQASGPIQRSTSRSNGVPGANLSRKSTVAPRGTIRAINADIVPESSAAPDSQPSSGLQRTRTIKLPDEDARPSRAASKISRSPSKYPGRGEDEQAYSGSPSRQDDNKSILSVGTETRAVLRHLDLGVNDSPESGSVINFDGEVVSTGPSSRSASRLALQRQGTMKSFLSSGGENTGKREQRLRRAETVVQNAVKRAATSAKKSASVEETEEKQKLRRAATTASASSNSSRPIEPPSTTSEAEHRSGPRLPSSHSGVPTQRDSSLAVPNSNIYRMARKSLVTETPDVPQFRERLSPGAETPLPSSSEGEQSPLRNATASPAKLERGYTSSSGRSYYSSGEDGPPSLVHGSTTSEDDEEEIPELGTMDGHGDTTIGAVGPSSEEKSVLRSDTVSKKSSLTPASASQFAGLETPQYLDTLETYRVEVDSPGREDVFAAMGRLGAHEVDFSLKSPLAGQYDDDTARLKEQGKSVGSQINDALNELTGSKSQSSLKRSSPTRKGVSRSGTRKAIPDIGVQEATPTTEDERAAFEDEQAQYAYMQPTQRTDGERTQGVELFDPPVGWKPDPDQQSQDANNQTPSKRRSWKQQNGRWTAAEDDSDQAESTSSMAERAVSPPPLPSPPKTISLSPTKDSLPNTPRSARRHRQNTSEAGYDSPSPSRRAQRTQTPEARLKATTSPASPSPFGRHADLFFSPPMKSGELPNSGSPGRSRPAGAGKYRSPRSNMPSAGSPLRAPTTRTRDILQADRVRPKHHRELSALSGSSENEMGGNETPAGTSALNSLAFSSPFAAGLDTPMSGILSPPHGAPRAPASEISSASDTTYQPSDLGGSDLLRRNTAMNAGQRGRRGTVSSKAESMTSTEYSATDAPTVSSLSIDDKGSEQGDAYVPRMKKQSTKSNATLSSTYTTDSEHRVALSEAEQKGRRGLDEEIEKMLQRQGL
ncbi:unnamed protein product [Sympodiomycopsis kandeliae]